AKLRTRQIAGVRDAFQFNCSNIRLAPIFPRCLQLRSTRMLPCLVETLRAFLFATTLRHFDGNSQ
ncbi:MAG: hypothetical protein M3H12_04190, partial [Chromatiales bacterium]